MHDLEPVGVFDARDDLLEEAAHAGLGHLSIRNDVVEQLAACVFEHENDVGRGRYDFV